MIVDLGTVTPGSTLRVTFDSYSGTDGSSITMTNFAVSDILIYKDGSTTERASTSGYTATTDFDSKTGKQFVAIDLADNTTAGFYAAGSEYLVAIDTVTIDGAATGGWLARFKIGYEGASLNTTIATLSTQTSFTLTNGPAEDDALNGRWAIIHDVASSVQCTWVQILDYTGSTKTVTLAAAGTYTAAATDNFSLMGPMPVQATVIGRTLDVTATGAAGVDWGNVENPTTTLTLSGTTVKTATDVETDTQDIQSRIPAALVGGRIDANMGAISTDSVAADNAESFFDGTGYAGTGNVIPTVTTLTNAPSDSSGVTTLLSRLSSARAGYLDNLSAGAVALASSLSTLQSDVTTLLGRITSTLFSGITSLGQWLGLFAGKQTGNSTARTEIRATGAGSGTFDETTDSLEALRDRGDAAWVTGGGGSISDIINIIPLIPQSVDLANTATWRIGFALTNAVDDLPTTAEITPGTITIDRKAIGGTTWSNVVNAAACSEAAGLIYYDQAFASGSGFAEGDSIRITLADQIVTVSANDYEITGTGGRIFYTEIRQTMRGTDGANTSSPPSAATIASQVRTELATELARIDAAISSRLATSGYTVPLDASGTRSALGMASANLDTQIASLDTLLDTAIAAIAALNNLSAAQVLTQVNSALDTAISELGVGAPTATPTLRTGLMLLYMALRNRTTTTSSTQTIQNNAGTTIASATVSDDGTTFTKAEFA